MSTLGSALANYEEAVAGLPKASQAWLTAALDPFHDTPIEGLAGYPGVQSRKTVTVAYRSTFVLEGATGGTSEGTFSNVQLGTTQTSLGVPLNDINLQFGSACTASEMAFTTPYVEGSSISSAVPIDLASNRPGAWAPAPISLWWKTQSGSSAGYRIFPNLPEVPYRVIARGAEITDATPKMYRQGMIYVSEAPLSQLPHEAWVIPPTQDSGGPVDPPPPQGETGGWRQAQARGFMEPDVEEVKGLNPQQDMIFSGAKATRGMTFFSPQGTLATQPQGWRMAGPLGWTEDNRQWAAVSEALSLGPSTLPQTINPQFFEAGGSSPSVEAPEGMFHSDDDSPYEGMLEAPVAITFPAPIRVRLGVSSGSGGAFFSSVLPVSSVVVVGSTFGNIGANSGGQWVQSAWRRAGNVSASMPWVLAQAPDGTWYPFDNLNAWQDDESLWLSEDDPTTDPTYCSPYAHMTVAGARMGVFCVPQLVDVLYKDWWTSGFRWVNTMQGVDPGPAPSSLTTWEKQSQLDALATPAGATPHTAVSVEQAVASGAVPTPATWVANSRDVSLSVVMPDTTSWELEKGAYLIPRMVHEPEWDTASGMSALNVTRAGLVGGPLTSKSLLVGLEPAGQYWSLCAGSTDGFGESTVNIVGANFVTAGEASEVGGTRLVVSVIYYCELLPPVRDTTLVSMAKPAALYDPEMLRIYTAARAALPLATPVHNNVIGGWLALVASIVTGAIKVSSKIANAYRNRAAARAAAGTVKRLK